MKNLLRKLSDNGIIYPLIFELAWGVVLLVNISRGLYNKADGDYDGIASFTITGLIVGVGIVVVSLITVCKFPFKKALPTIIFWVIELVYSICFVFELNGFWVEEILIFLIPPIWVSAFLLYYYTIVLCAVIIAIPFLKLLDKNNKEKWENHYKNVENNIESNENG
jgi:hypothetical protein